MGEQAWGAGMSVWVTVLLFLVGLVLIIKGGDWFLSGAVWIAEATGVPRFIIRMQPLCLWPRTLRS